MSTPVALPREVRYMLLCDHAQATPAPPHRVNVYGLLSAIRPAQGELAYPLQHSFAVYLALTKGRGSGQGRIVVEYADMQTQEYIGQPHEIRFTGDPLHVKGVVFRLADCRFSAPGLYWVEFLCNDKVIARQPLLVG